ncbi:hypothetical protein OnM2_075050 [Erysiphe neolycopersici]|uniref:Uncharacterized protein n=1 Tax=Erysiphe neolycopersici TaxID=212602 RepID=A0A420HIK9_9PEZI|nr:hypothetical protein OnM2_075050 [Erysiphe neolycopersici]
MVIRNLHDFSHFKNLYQGFRPEALTIAGLCENAFNNSAKLYRAMYVLEQAKDLWGYILKLRINYARSISTPGLYVELNARMISSRGVLFKSI